jgi:hypothetical protein
MQQHLQQLYETTVRPLPKAEQLELVSLILNETRKPDPTSLRTLREIMQSAPGGQIFKSPEEVDEYLRAERDSWDR